MPGTHGRLPVPNRRKVGMTSSPHDPYVLGCTHATMLATKGSNPVRGSESQKGKLSSDRGLQLDLVKLESLVIADQQRRGEYVPGPCTHRPSHHESGQHPKPVAQPLWREPSKVGLAIDAVAPGADEGRVRLRKAPGSRQQGFDPEVSEWGNPTGVMPGHPGLNT